MKIYIVVTDVVNDVTYSRKSVIHVWSYDFYDMTLSTGKQRRHMIIHILTHLAYIANGKKRVILCNNFTGRISVTLLCGICDVSYPTKQR